MFMYVHTCTFVRAGDSGPHHAGASGANWAVLLFRNLQLANKRLWAVTTLQKSSRGTARAQREVAQSSVENMGSRASDLPRRRAGWQVVKRNTPFAIQRCCDPAPKKKRRDPSVSPVRLRIFSHHKQTAYCSHDNSVGPAGSVGANLKK